MATLLGCYVQIVWAVLTPSKAEPEVTDTSQMSDSYETPGAERLLRGNSDSNQANESFLPFKFLPIHLVESGGLVGKYVICEKDTEIENLVFCDGVNRMWTGSDGCLSC